MNPLEAEQLSRITNSRRIIDRIDLSIAAGEIVVVLGANGAGKTTLVRCLACCLRPTSGRVLWFGNSPVRRPADHRLVGFASHAGFVYPELSARENLLFAARMYGVAAPQQRVVWLLSSAGLGERADLPTGRLSAGWRQRLSIARALIHDPPIVIMDEPLAGMDADGRQWLGRWLKELRDQGRAICITGHDEESCGGIANRWFELRDGTLQPRGKHPKYLWTRSA